MIRDQFNTFVPGTLRVGAGSSIFDCKTSLPFCGWWLSSSSHYWVAEVCSQEEVLVDLWKIGYIDPLTHSISLTTSGILITSAHAVVCSLVREVSDSTEFLSLWRKQSSSSGPHALWHGIASSFSVEWKTLRSILVPVISGWRMAEVRIEDVSIDIEIFVWSISSSFSPCAAVNTGSGVLDTSTLHDFGSVNID